MSKPTALAPKPETIPAEIKPIKAWVMWRYELKEQKWTKVPYQQNGKKARSNDPSTWGSFTYAIEHCRPDFDGIGFMLSKQHGIVGVDLDHCVGETVKPWAVKIMFDLDTYTEFSPSRTGLRILLKGILPPNGRKKDNIEMYDSRRFLTITGNHRVGLPYTIEARERQIEALHKRVFTKPEAIKPRNGHGRENISSLDLDDSELLEKAFRAKNGANIKALYSGDIGGRGRSEADMSLCGHLAWYSQDPTQIDRLFRNSGLMREKWDERHFADGRTYGEGTISRVLDSGKVIR